MANAAQASTYELLQIEKNGVVVDITGTDPYGARTTSFDYYESLLSPNSTAVLSLIDVGGSAPSSYDKQNRRGTLDSALPLTGDVNVRFKITNSATGKTLDFTRKPFVLDKKISPSDESNRQGMILSLVSSTASKNKIPVYKKYNGNIANSIEKLIKDYIGSDQTVITDPTKNSWSYTGNDRTVCKVACEAARQSIPLRGNPGYFFYETQLGMNFRSIDDLIRQDPKANYFKTDVLRSGVDTDENNFKIALKSVIKSEDYSTAALAGALQTRNVFIDPVLYTVEHIDYRLSDIGLDTSLGKEIDVPSIGALPTHLYLLDIGSLDPGVSVSANNNPKEWQAKSKMRYNSLFSQIIQIQVPCNLSLVAGDTINCDFEIITQDKKDQGRSDPTTSGKYLILNLCHHFDATRSFTSMTLVRDSYGLHTNKNK
jgi:hypothetical protein